MKENKPRYATKNKDERQAYFIGGGIGSLAGAAFLVRDGGFSGENIVILEEGGVNGGACDGSGNGADGYVIRGGRELNLKTYECTWALFADIPSLRSPGKSVYEEILDFNTLVKTRAKARLVNRHRQRLDTSRLGFSAAMTREFIALLAKDESRIGASRISDWFSEAFFDSTFWHLMSTTFAFLPWHSAAEFRRYVDRFIMDMGGLFDLSCLARTPLNQYESMVLPLEAWLRERGVRFETGKRVYDLELRRDEDDRWVVRSMELFSRGPGESGERHERLAVGANDLVFAQNGSMTDAASIGSMDSPPARLAREDGVSFRLWSRIADGRPEFGNPDAFDRRIDETQWMSFTVTCDDAAFFNRMIEFSGNTPGTGALVTFKDSSWYMSVVLAYQPHFGNQPGGCRVFWGNGLLPDRVGDFVPKRMSDCCGAEILEELRGHLGFERGVWKGANCIPCMMPFITSQFEPRRPGDRPLPVPKESRNLGFISQFVEMPRDVVFTVEYSVRAAQEAVYGLLGLDRASIPPVTRHDRGLGVKLRAARSMFYGGRGPRRNGRY